MFDKVIMVITGLIGSLLLAIGLRWLVDPSDSAEALGMPRVHCAII